MELSFGHILILFVVGLAVGFLNVIAGGGSLLSIPLLIFIGFPVHVANATSRVGIFFQNLVAVSVYKNSGFKNDRFIYLLTLSSILGSALGTWWAVQLDSQQFNRILIVVMILMFFLILIDPRRFHTTSVERLEWNRQLLSIIIFFFIGIYGGFLQAGTAILMMVVLHLVNNLQLVKVNYMKVFVVLIMNILSLVIFQLHGLIEWKYGFLLAAGTSLGGYVGTVVSIKKGDIWIRRVMLATIAAITIKLLAEQWPQAANFF